MDNGLALGVYGLIVAVVIGGIILSAVASTLHVDMGLLGFVLGSFWFLIGIIVLVMLVVVLLIAKTRE